MIFPITSEAEEIIMMDENDYQEHLLLTSLDEKEQQEKSLPTTLSEATSSLMNEEEADDSEFLNTDKVGEITPTKCSEKSSNSPSTEEQEPTSDDPAEVGIPGKFDVLCGQSRICANHTGNRRFQVVLDIYAPKYDGSTSKQEKMALTKEIVSCIENAGGHFLKYKEGLWQEISTVTARDKVSHALRTKVASWKRQQQQQGTSDLSPSSKSRPTHRRRRSSTKRRRSSSSIATSASDILTTSFDGSSDSASSIMDDLLKTQREIFANLTQGVSNVEHPIKKE